MRKFTLLILGMLLALTSPAKDITGSEALQIAGKFLKQRTGPQKAPSAHRQSLRQAYTAKGSDGKNCFYVFNNGNNGGFVIVAADDMANEVLGYSDTGSFDYDALPDYARNWMEGYSDQITFIRSTPEYKTAGQPEGPGKTVKPLLGDIRWSQDAPYNNLCPSYGLNQRCATGCVATAMAQVMYYHKWPVQGKGSHSYQPAILGGATLTADFGNTKYDWDSMLPQYDSNSSDAAGQAVAQLMLHCGVSVDMVYSLSSGASDVSVPAALFNYFDYDRAIAFRQRSNYDNTEWEKVIENELDNGRPVIALGRSSAGGHCFVFDGYDENGLVHVNWGWAGMSNGYFRTTALNPAVQGIGGSDGGYNYSQSIVTGIQEPQDGSVADIELVSSEGLVPSAMTIGNGAEFDIRLHGFVNNAGWQDADYEYGLLLCNAEGDIVKAVSTGLTQQLPVGYMIEVPEFEGVTLGTLAEGSYRLYPACRPNGADGPWTRIRDEYVGYPNYVNAVCKDGKVRFSYPDYFDLKVTGMTSPKEIYASLPAQVTATIENNGDVDYLGEVTVELLDKDTKRNVATSDSYKIGLKPGESVTLDIDGTFKIEPGDYLLTVTDDDGRRISGYRDITVNAAPAEAAVIEPAEQLAFSDPESVDKNNLDITAKITCRQGVFAGFIYLYIFNEGGSVQMGCLEPKYVLLKEGETADITFGGPFENGVPGTTYTASLLAYNGTSYSFLSPIEMSVCQFRLAGTTGIDSPDAGEEGVTDIYDLTGKRIDATSTKNLPKGIYIVKKGGKTFKTAVK